MIGLTPTPVRYFSICDSAASSCPWTTKTESGGPAVLTTAFCAPRASSAMASAMAGAAAAVTGGGRRPRPRRGGGGGRPAALLELRLRDIGDPLRNTSWAGLVVGGFTQIDARPQHERLARQAASFAKNDRDDEAAALERTDRELRAHPIASHGRRRDEDQHAE